MDMLAIRHDRSTCENVLKMLQEYSNRKVWLRNRELRAVRNETGTRQRAALLRWMDVSRSWRGCRHRLHSTLQRWARSNALRALASWKVESSRLLAIGRGLRRLLSAQTHTRRKRHFESWIDAVNLQTHRKNVLTRIVLRTQDRCAAAAVRDWSDLCLASTGLSFQEKHLVAKHHAASATRALRAWQRVRQRGLRALAMIDASARRWGAILAALSLNAFRDGALWRRLCRVRSAAIAINRARLARADALRAWRLRADERRRLRTTGRVLARRSAARGRAATAAAWAAAAREAATLRALRAKGARRIAAVAGGAALTGWAAATTRERGYRSAVGRARTRRGGRLLADFFGQWTFGTGLATRILGLHERTVGRQRRNLLGASLTAWCARARLERSARDRGAVAARAGREAGARPAATAFGRWALLRREARRLRRAMRVVARLCTGRAAFRSWAAGAREFAMQAGRFRHILACAAQRRTRAALGGWREEHVGALALGRRLPLAMRSWERRRLAEAFAGWALAARRLQRLAAAFSRLTVKGAAAAAAAALAGWLEEAARRSQLRRRASRLALASARGAQAAALQLWIGAVVEDRVRGNKLFRLAARQAEARAARRVGAWRDAADALYARGLAVRRCAARVADGAALGHLRAWSDRLQSTKAKELGLARRIDSIERAAAGRALEAWDAATQRLMDLRDLRGRCVTHMAKRAAEGALWAWFDVARRLRILSVKHAAVAERRAKALLLGIAAVWTARARDARKLRLGLSKLILYQQDRSLQSAFGPWFDLAKHVSRMRRNLTTVILRQNRQGMWRSMQTWASAKMFSFRAELVVASAFAKLHRRTKLVMFSGWVVLLRQIQHDRIFSVRQSAKRSAILATDYLIKWKSVSKVGVHQSKRVTRFVSCKSRSTVGNALDYWFGFVRSEKCRLDGLDRCVMRWMNRTLRLSLNLWGEMSMYLKRMRKAERSLQFKSSNAQYTFTVRTLEQLSRKKRHARQLLARKNDRDLATLLNEWMFITTSMSRKRRDLKKLMDRLVTNLTASALFGWNDLAKTAVSEKSRCAALQSRCKLHRIKACVSALIKNMKTSKGFFRHKTAFDRRWKMTRQKNACDHWSQWHQKKMAVKVRMIIDDDDIFFF